MRYLAMIAGGVVLSCGGCVVHEAVPIAAPASQAASAPAAQNCREFQNTVVVGGKPQQAYGTTCQQADGSWQISSPPETSPPPPVAAPAPYAAYPVYPAYPPYPYYPPYYGYPGYYGPSVGIGFRFGGRGRWH